MMKPNIHPEYRTVVFHDTSVDEYFKIGSTIKTDREIELSGLNRASAGCFTRMTGSGRRLLRTYSVNALWRRWGVL